MLLVKDGFMIDPQTGIQKKQDILIKVDRISEIGINLWDHLTKEEQDQCEVIQAEGMIVAPGLVDVHVHFRDPGFTYKEDIESGARAAAKGGFTSVVLMANTKPMVDNEETLKYILNKGLTTGIHVETCATITKGMKGQELSPMEDLLQAGAKGFTDDGIPLLEEELVRKAMNKAKMLGVPLSLHEEDPKFITNNGIHEGKASSHYQVQGSKREAEISLIERDLQIALETGAIVNIQHISSKEGVQLIREAKKKGTNIHGEATPHHFTLTEDAVIQYGTMAKMNPPLREEADRQAIVEGIKDGTIDLIATDHAPHSKEEKEKPITQAPSGILGLETALALGITQLVNQEGISMLELIRCMSLNPANLYGLDAGYLKEAGPGDLCIFDPKKEWSPKQFLSHSQNSPFIGWKLRGSVIYTICRGKIIYQYDEK